MRDWKEEIRQRLVDLRLAPTRAAEIVAELAQHRRENCGAWSARWRENQSLLVRTGGAI